MIVNNLTQYDRFRRTPPLVFDGRDTYGTWKQPSWLVTRPADDLIGRIVASSQHEGKPHLLAQDIYDSQLLHWVLIAFNFPRSAVVFGWPRAGDIVEYPDESLVIPEL